MQCNHAVGTRRCKANALKGKHKCLFHNRPGKMYRQKKGD